MSLAESDSLLADDSLTCGVDNVMEDLSEEWMEFEAAEGELESQLVRRLGLGSSPEVGTRTASDSDEENTVPAEIGRGTGKKGKAGVLSGRGVEDCLRCKTCQKTFDTASLLNEHVTNFCGSSVRQERDDDGKKVEEKTGTLAGENQTRQKKERGRKYYEQLKTERKYQCEICQKTFITNGHLSTHMHRHSGKKWTCDGCGRNFSCVRSLVRHRDTFPGEHWFPCKFCDMTFFRAANIAKHMEIKHPEVAGDKEAGKTQSTGDGFSCQTCSRTFPNEEGLLSHVKSIHAGEGRVDDAKYKCEVCAKEFVSAEGFDYHMTHRHAEEKEVGKGKKGKKAVSTDEEDDEGTSFVCKLCSAPCGTKSALQTHLKTHNVTKNVEVKSGSHQCCICPRSFTSSDSLKYHLATHTGERRYSCGQCGKRFIKKTHLSEHIATHSEVKYFKCPRCPRTFSTHSAYRKHTKQFPGPHSFPCKKCGKLFTKESMIEKHMCVDLVKITMAPEVKALLSEDMIEEYLCLAEEQMAAELEMGSGGGQGERNSDDVADNAPQSCYKCFKVFPNLASLQAHQNDHIGKQNYQCRFCPESFKRADAFGAHIRNHLGSTPYMCLKCNRKFISPFTLSMHAKNYPGDHSFTCRKCSRWFPSEKRLENHECILQNCDHFACACGSSFNSWSELLDHAGPKPYKCCSCELKYPTLTALARHIKKHTGVKPFSCEVCGKSFRAKNNYLNHKNIHKDAKEIQCEHCEYKSKSQKRMDFHLFRKHDIGSNAKSTLCPFCGVIFPYISHMKKHVELEHGNEMLDETLKERKAPPAELCTLCGKLLNNKYTLANHMKKVHDPNAAKKERQIKCEFCEEVFPTVKMLRRHAEAHETPVSRACDVCHKEFYFAKDLRKHMRKHDTSKPFSCQRCGKHFKVSASLKYHSVICGLQRPMNARKRKEEKEEMPAGNELYGHVDPVIVDNQQCMLYSS